MLDVDAGTLAVYANGSRLGASAQTLTTHRILYLGRVFIYHTDRPHSSKNKDLG